MKQILPVTEQERSSWPSDVIVPLEKAHVDEGGEIQPLVDMDMKSCVLISSKKGTVRANHYHKTDWHYCYVLRDVSNITRTYLKIADCCRSDINVE
jgi:hypothetical protein